MMADTEAPMPGYGVSGREILYGAGRPEAASAVDFWRWAFGDLRQNSLRGVFAEWMVARLLGCQTECRDPWAACDLLLANGTRIEVKASARRQAWHEDGSRPSSVVFSGLHARSWEAATGRSTTSDYNADIYVFCLFENLPNEADPFNLEHWRFWLMARETLARSTPNSPMRRSITLASLCREGIETTAAQLSSVLIAMS